MSLLFANSPLEACKAVIVLRCLMFTLLLLPHNTDAQQRYIYWQAGQNIIYRMDEDGQNKQVLYEADVAKLEKLWAYLIVPNKESFYFQLQNDNAYELKEKSLGNVEMISSRSISFGNITIRQYDSVNKIVYYEGETESGVSFTSRYSLLTRTYEPLFSNNITSYNPILDFTNRYYYAIGIDNPFAPTKYSLLKRSMDGDEPSTVYIDNFSKTKPIDVNLDILHHQWYWANYDRENKKSYIYRANFDGQETHIIATTGADVMQELALDVLGNRIYWIQEDAVYRAFLDGTHQEKIQTIGTGTNLQLSFENNGILVANESEAELPETVMLDQNYPNPFNPSTTIRFSLPSAGNVKLEVFDLLGRSLGILANTTFAAGAHEVTFQANQLQSGVYFYRLETGQSVVTKRMTLVK
jgi:hypothetical protein